MTAVNSRLTNPRQIALFATNETELSVVRETRIAKKPSSHEYFWYSKTFLYFLFTGSQPPLAFRQLFDRQPDIRLADKGKHDSAGQPPRNSSPMVFLASQSWLHLTKGCGGGLVFSRVFFDQKYVGFNPTAFKHFSTEIATLVWGRRLAKAEMKQKIILAWLLY